MAFEDPREASSDPLDILCWLIGQGYSVAFSGVYRQSQFHVRAVRNETVLIQEGKELHSVMKEIRREAQKVGLRRAAQ